MGNPSIVFGEYVPKLRGELLFSGVNVKDNKAIVVFKPKNDYKGEFGFDWCEWNIENGIIEKFQDTEASDIEYTFNDTEQKYISATDVNIYKILKSLYPKKSIGFGKQYYISWMNLPKGNKATLKLTTIYISKRESADDEEYITFKPNTDYDINYNGQLNDTIKIPLKKKNKATYDIEIFAKNETENNSYIEAIDEKGNIVGIIEMHPNKKVDLDIKIIPVVFKSTEVKEKSEATILYNKTIKAKTTDLGNSLDDTLNKHSLNQAGIQCKIKTIKTNPERIVIDLATDNWGKFYDSTKKEFKNWEFTPTESNASKRPSLWISEDGDKAYEYKEYEVEEKDATGIVIGTKKVFKTKNDKRLLLDELEDAYYTEYSREFKGALLFVTEENYYKPDTLGYSQSNPLRSQGTVVFKAGLGMSEVYAHELGHMLGLEHVFLKTEEDEITEITKNIATQNLNITNYEENIQNRKELIENRNENIAFETKRMNDYAYNEDGSIHSQEYIDEQQAKIAKHQAEIDEYDAEIKDFENKIEDFKRKIAIEKGRGFKIKEGTSTNFMDYDISRLYFDKFQCLVMQQEVKHFYND
ncbi:hypothetical protein [Aquimarina aquimarini]|uniref:hypothetical protein n=1 Tax=Aquimarina aquimarini TaxID=1191734 RepID=UPI000D55FAE0|nr:hypothetical protein [Aquimarina aquimarini]